MKNNILKFSLLAIFALINTLPLLAGPGGGGTDDDSEYPAPIDNWILLLVLAAVAVGTFFILKNRRKAIA